MPPKVSVIIPVYNAKSFVEKCLGYCVNQTLQDIEIIVIDDKSTDNTAEIVRSVMQNDNRIKLIQLEKNSRQGYARNIGIKHANGDYIMFLDVDDRYELNCVEKMYKKITEDDSDMTVCKFYTVDFKSQKTEKNHDFKNYSDIPEQLYSGFCYKDIDPDRIFDKCNVVWDKIYKKSFIIDNHIEFPAGMYCEDDVFSFKAFFRAKKITVLNEYLVYYLINRNDSSSIIGDETAFDCFRMFELIKEDLLSLNLYYQLIQSIVVYHVNVCLYFYSLVKNKYRKKFFDKMKSELSNYRGFLDNTQNSQYHLYVYNNLKKILDNNFYTYELKTLWENLFAKSK